MKKQILLGLVMAATTTVFGQVTLTKATNNPVAGDIFYGYLCDTAHATKGASGASVMWDMSALVKNDSDTTSYLACAATPYCDSFPGANIVMFHDSEYSYGFSGTDGIELMGVFSDGGPIHFTDRSTMTKFPVTYNTVVKDTFRAKINMMGADLFLSGYTNSTCDAYGTLKLPNGTFNNVLRMKTIRIIKDSVFFMGMSNVNVRQTEEYSWYMSGFHSALLTVSYDTTGSATPYVSDVKYYKATPPPSVGVGEVVSAGSVQSVFPNPATNEITVRVEVPVQTNVSVSILNMAGQVVYRANNEPLKTGINELALPVHMLGDGMYMVRLQGEGMQLTSRFSVVK